MNPTKATTTRSVSTATSTATHYDNHYRFRDWDLGYYPELVPEDDDDDFEDAARAALEATIRRYRRRLVRAAHCRLGSRRRAEDLVQDVCVDVLRGQLALPVDPAAAADVLLEAIVERCADQEEDDAG